LAWLDQIRGGAALFVVIHHAVKNIVVTGPVGPLWSGVATLTAPGHFAVDVFIVLSGYCLMLPLLKKGSFGSFYGFIERRFIRIALPYYAAIVVALLLIWTVIGGHSGTLWDQSVNVDAFSIVSHILLIHQLWDGTGSSISHPLWSVGVEFWIYLIFPFLFWALRRFGAIRTLWVTTVLSYAAWGLTLITGWPNPSPWGASFYYVALFLFGMVAAQRAAGQAPVTKLSVHPGEAALLVLLAVIALVANRMGAPLQIQSAPVGAFVALALTVRARQSWLNERRGLIGRALGGAGLMGFSIYLIHAPILELVWRYAVAPLNLTPGASGAMEIALGLGATLMAAWLFYLVIEKPCHAWSQRRKMQRAGVEKRDAPNRRPIPHRIDTPSAMAHGSLDSDSPK
jgi:peptidoglycan/LPS O-acetylase OafA/YrhL